MRRSLLLVLLCSCAAQQVRKTSLPVPEYSFSGLQGQHVKVEVVDVGRVFDAAPAVLSATKQAVEHQLSSHGVVIDDAAPRRLLINLAPPDTKLAYSAQSCVQVTGRLETTAQAYLPTQESTATRCGGKSPGAGPGDPVGALFALIGTAVAEANGATHRELAQALSEALADVLAQLDARTRAQ